MGPIIVRRLQAGDNKTRTLFRKKGCVRDEILDILSKVAPDEDLSDLEDAKNFREQLELDSMDFLDIVLELKRRHRVLIPEEDYGNLASMASTVSYLEPKMRDIVKT
jgi:acyl carrier protein